MDGSPKTARSAIPKPKIAYDKGEDVRIMEIPPVIHAALEPFSVYLRRSGGLLFTCGQVPAITSNLSQASNKPVHRRRADTVASGTPQVAAESQRLHRRGRGRRKNDAYWMAYNKGSDTDPFDDRECLFEDENGQVKMPALANLDTGLKVPGGLIMSTRYVKELGRYQDISKDFVDPYMRSISGHHTTVTGILRNVTFRLKGTSATFIRDFYVCDAIDGLVDVMMGASFIKDHFKLLFEKVKECFSTFATWFSTKKEDPVEKEERERREREQRIEANNREIARLRKEQELLGAQQRRS